MRYHVRCKKRTCYARHVLPRHPDEYERAPRCQFCGNNEYTIDKWKTNRDTSKDTCTCNGYTFGAERNRPSIHRRGSLRCHFRKDGTKREPGDADFYYESEEEREWYASSKAAQTD